jgi:two-component system response regulator HydG
LCRVLRQAAEGWFPAQVELFRERGWGSGGDSTALANGKSSIAALEKLNGDKLMAATKLGIGKTTLYRKLKKYGITVEEASSRVIS